MSTKVRYRSTKWTRWRDHAASFLFLVYFWGMDTPSCDKVGVGELEGGWVGDDY